MSDEFWAKMRRVAKIASKDPDWSKAGINLNPQNFETYRRDIEEVKMGELTAKQALKISENSEKNLISATNVDKFLDLIIEAAEGGETHVVVDEELTVSEFEWGKLNLLGYNLVKVPASNMGCTVKISWDNS